MKNKISKLKSDICDAVNSKIVDVGIKHHHFLCSTYQCMKIGVITFLTPLTCISVRIRHHRLFVPLTDKSSWY